MKKVLAAGCAVLMCGCFALTACDKGGNAEIGGNYRTPTSEELSAALGSIDAEKLFGDPAAENYTFGLSLSSEFDIGVIAPGTTVSADGSADLDISVSEEQTAGAGEVSLNFSSTGEEGQDLSVRADAYTDAQYVYFNASLSADGEELPMNGKVDIASLLADMPGMMTTDTETSTAPSADFGAMIAQLTTMGMEIGLDTSDGVKLRFTADAACLQEMMKQTELTAPIDFGNSSIVLYLYINSDGMFEQFSAVVDIDCDVQGEEPGSITAEGNFILKRSDKSVTLPSDLDDEEKYPLLSGMGGF